METGLAGVGGGGKDSSHESSWIAPSQDQCSVHWPKRGIFDAMLSIKP